MEYIEEPEHIDLQLNRLGAKGKMDHRAYDVKRRSVRGILILLVGTGFLQVFAVVATFLLTVFLDPAHYGIFAVTAAAVDLLIYFSDIGMAGAIIQKKDLRNEDLKTTFTIQQILSLLLVVVGFFSSGFVVLIYHLSVEGLWLFRALLLSFFLSTLKTIPSVLLERELEFGKLIIPQLVETVSFYGIAVILAWQGYGITSFTIAVIVRSVFGLLSVYFLRPWVPQFGIDKSAFRRLASFGLPFQINSILGLVKDRLLVVYYGAVLPATHVGYLQWAERWSLFPHRLIVDNVGKVTFPAYSRLQSKKEELARAIEKSLFFTTLFIFPALVGMVLFAPTLIQIIPRYIKWQPALAALLLFSINAAWSSVSTSLTNAFAALGKIRINVKLMVMWTALTWMLTPLFLRMYGFTGVALASAIVACTSFIPLIIVKRLLPVRIARNILPALFSAAFMGFALYGFSFLLSPFSFILLAVPTGVILYLAFMFLFSGRKMLNELSVIRQFLRP